MTSGTSGRFGLIKLMGLLSLAFFTLGGATSFAAPRSVEGARIPTLAQIIDPEGATWSVRSGTVYKDGKATVSSGVVALFLLHGIIYQETSRGHFWYWNKSGWAGSVPDPRRPSLSGSTIPSHDVLIDSNLNMWALSSGVVYLNGGKAGYSSGVAKLILEKGIIYQENGTGLFWSWNGSAWIASSNPIGSSPTPSPSPSPTHTPTPTHSPSPSPSPSATHSASPSPSPSPTITVAPIPPTPGSLNVGLNFPSINYYNNAPIYYDVSNQFSNGAGVWNSKSDGTAAPLDNTGAPTVPATTSFTALYPTGTYTVQFSGNGTLTINGQNFTGPCTGTRCQLQWTQQSAAPNGSPYAIVQSSGANVSNIHILAPASQLVTVGTRKSVFLEDFITKIQPVSTLRFMDALQTNSSRIANWSQRTWPGRGSRGLQKSQGGQGIAYEDIIDLANTTGKDVWINVPARATDDYVCRMARLFAYGESGLLPDGSIAPDGTCPMKSDGTPVTSSHCDGDEACINSKSKIHIEYANEVWNSQFQQFHDLYCMANGVVDDIRSCVIDASTGACCTTTACSADPSNSTRVSCTSTGYPENPPVGLNCNICDSATITSNYAKATLNNPALQWTPKSGNLWNRGNQMSVVLTKRNGDFFKSVFGALGNAGQIKIAMNVQAVNPAEVTPGFALVKDPLTSVSGFVDELATAPYYNIESFAFANSGDLLYENLLAYMSGPSNASVTNFSASSGTVSPSQPSTILNWSTSGAASVTLDGQTVNLSGQLEVAPPETTTYTLIAADTRGQSTTWQVTVKYSATPVEVAAKTGKAILSNYGEVSRDLAFAQSYNLPLVAYEGGAAMAAQMYLGAGTVTATTAQQATIAAFNQDPRIYKINQLYLQNWKALNGNSLFNYYTMVGGTGFFGSFGALLTSEDPGSHKWDGILSSILVTGDVNGDGVVDQADCAILKQHYGTTSGMWWSDGDFNHDGRVDAADLALLNSHISGEKCAITH